MNSLIIFIYKILSLFPNIKKKHYETMGGNDNGNGITGRNSNVKICERINGNAGGSVNENTSEGNSVNSNGNASGSINENTSDGNSVNTGGYIENQWDYPQIKFGKTTLSKCGCGVVACYNLLIFLGYDVKISQIIKYFENNGMIFNGRFGVNPLSIKNVLGEFSIETTEKVLKKKEDAAKFFSGSLGGIILIFSEERKLLKGFHFLFVYQNKKGEYITKNPRMKLDDIHNGVYGIRVEKK